MHLRLGSRLGRTRAPSRAPTQGSGTQFETTQDEQEIEATYSPTSSESDSMSGSGDMYDQMGPHEQAGGVGTSQVDATPSFQLDFNTRLKYDYTNVYGAEIYHDPMLRQVYKTAEHLTPFEQSLMANYQGEMYVGEDGARYQVTEFPHLVDSTGYIHPQQGTMDNEADISLRRGMGPDPQGPLPSKGSKGQSKSQSANPFENDDEVREQGEEPEVNTGFAFETGFWTLIKEVPVWRIFQDDMSRVVYRDEWRNVYATEAKMGLKFPVTHSIMFEELTNEVGRVRDTWNNEYRVLSPTEISSLRWKGKPVEIRELEVESTARPGTSAYEGETITPTISADRLRSILGEPSSKYNSKDSPGVVNSKFRMTPPLTPVPAPFEQNLRESHDFRAVPIPREEPGYRRLSKRHGGGDSRKVRPSALQKLVKKYDGSGDPFDHIAAFKQAVHAEQVSDTHTKIEGFGLKARL